jgi:hypothetical protein
MPATTPAVTTIGGQLYTGAVTLEQDTVLANTTNGEVAFLSTLDAATAGQTSAGQQSLDTTGTAGNARFEGRVGATALEQLSVAGTTKLSVGGLMPATTPAVTTSGDQIYAGAVRLEEDTTLTSAGGEIRFQSSVDSEMGEANDLIVDTAGLTSFEGDVGSAETSGTGADTGLGSLATRGGGTTRVGPSGSGTGVRTLRTIGGLGTSASSGSQSHGDALRLAQDAVIRSAGGAGLRAISFESSIDSEAGEANELTGDTAGLTRFEGQVGGSDALARLSVSGPATLSVGGLDPGAPAVTTRDGQLYSGAVTLEEDTVLANTTSGEVAFGSTLDAANAGAQSLDITGAAGNARFEGRVGTTALEKLSVAGTTKLSVGGLMPGTPAVTTADGQLYSGAVTLQEDTVLTNTASGEVAFASTLDGTSPGQQSLDITGMAGNARFEGRVGGTTAVGWIPLERLDVAGNTVFDAPGGTPADPTVTTQEGQRYRAGVVLARTTVLKNLDSGGLEIRGTVGDGGSGASFTLLSESSVSLGDDVSIGGALEVEASRNRQGTTLSTRAIRAHSIRLQGSDLDDAFVLDGDVIAETGDLVVDSYGTLKLGPTRLQTLLAAAGAVRINAGTTASPVDGRRISVPPLATIFERNGDLTIRAGTESVLGRLEKLTVVGNLTIDGTGTTRIGDLSALRIQVNPLAILLQRVGGTTVLGSGEVIQDAGVDYVANQIVLAGGSQAGGSGSIIFATQEGGVLPPGAPSGALPGRVFADGSALEAGDFFAPDGSVLDLNGSLNVDRTPSDAVFTPPEEVSLRTGVLDGLNDVAKRQKPLWPIELITYWQCMVLFQDEPDELPEQCKEFGNIARRDDPRFETEPVQRVRESYARIMRDIDRATAALQRAADDYLATAPAPVTGAGFGRFVRAEKLEAKAYLDELGQIDAYLPQTRLKDPKGELQAWFQQVIDDLAPNGLSPEDLREAIRPEPVALRGPLLASNGLPRSQRTALP